MTHHPLIATVVLGFVLAFVFGALAQRLRVSPLVGYLLAGVLVGPYTPGIVADQGLASALAEIGVILLMFGVGLHFSLGSLLSVRSIAVPGAIIQMAVATLLGMGLARLQGWPVEAGFIFGLALSVPSTVVMTRTLQERRLIETTRGRIAVGWLVVEDLILVLILVLIPPSPRSCAATSPSDATSPWQPSGYRHDLRIHFEPGRRVHCAHARRRPPRHPVDFALRRAHRIARTIPACRCSRLRLASPTARPSCSASRSRLGAFFAGMMLHESPLSQRAAEESLPLRDAFAVLFFVSVGMLFDPSILIRAPFLVVATLLVILIGNSLTAFGIMRAFGHPMRTALTVAASLAQIGEFSFILAGLGVALDILPAAGRDLILAGALISIIVNPLLFFALERMMPASETKKRSRSLRDSRRSWRSPPKSRRHSSTITRC